MKRFFHVAMMAIFLSLITPIARAQFEFREDRAVGNTVVYQTTGGRFSADEAIVRALSSDGTGVIRIVGEQFRLAKPIKSNRSNLSIELSPRTKILVSNTLAVGCIDLSGDNVSVIGGTIVVDTFVDNQVIVRLRNSDTATIRDLKVDVLAIDGDGATPMTVIKLEDATNVILDNVTVHPNAGVRALYFDECVGSRVVNSHFGPPAGEATRDCWRVIDAVGGSNVHIASCSILDLGTAETMLDECIVHTETEANTQNGFAITNCDIETVACRNLIHLKGTKSFRIVDNFLSEAVGIEMYDFVERFDSTVYVENTGSTISSATNAYAAHGIISDNNFSGNAFYSAPEVAIRAGGKIDFIGNHIGHGGSEYGVIFDADHTQSLIASGNSFDGFAQAGTPWRSQAPFFIVNRLTDDDTGATENIDSLGLDLWEHVEHIVTKDNFAEGYNLGNPITASGYGSFPWTYGVRGSYSFGGISGWAQQITKTDVTFSTTSNTITSATDEAFAGFRSGDTIMVLGSSAPENNGLRTVVSLTSTGGGTDNNILTVNTPSDSHSPDVTLLSSAAGPFSDMVITSSTITRPSGSFISDGFITGQFVLMEDAEDAANNRMHYVTTVAALTLTVSPATLTANTADSTATLKRAGIGYDMVTDASAGETIRIYVYPSGGIGSFIYPLQSNIFSRNLSQ